MLKIHDWDKPSPTEKSDSKPIELFATSAAEDLFTSVRPTKDSTEHRTLEKEIGFNYRQVLGELTYAYVVGRLDISYAVTLLARYSFTPNRCPYLALKRLCKDLRRTIDWGIPYWRQAPCDLLPAGDFKNLSVDNKDLHEFPKFSNLLEVVGVAMDPSTPLQSFASPKLVHQSFASPKLVHQPAVHCVCSLLCLLP
jgi:hypothetical protein